MQVSRHNNVKIYNLSLGKSVPEWISERERRTLLKKNANLRRRIELIQDFCMPAVSQTIRLSPDGQFIFVTGIYKPRIRCFDVNNLSLKFERCYDSEAVTFEILSDDYKKFVLLECDRNVEFHTASGVYHKLRIPRFGRDMKYNKGTCDLYLVGASPEIYRINLERGQFLEPYKSSVSEINKCEINPVHQLLLCGSDEGIIEAWDPRVRECVGKLDCAIHCIDDQMLINEVPSISSLKFKNDITLGVGTSTGQTLLYDIRLNKPFYSKISARGLPIRNIEFHYQNDLIFSMDREIVNIWNYKSGELFTSIEPGRNLNDLSCVPNSGMFFIANEKPKILTYFIPTLGPAPKWATFLDSITEELEESNSETIYQDFKFVTNEDLAELNLENLIGTRYLKAYLHGYFVDVRLYNKAKNTSEKHIMETNTNRKIKQTVDKDTSKRVKYDELPKYNQELAEKLIEVKSVQSEKKKKKTIIAENLLNDVRFASKLFNDPDYKIDRNSKEFRQQKPKPKSKSNKIKK